MKLHEIKIENKYFWDVAYGKKTAEIRKNDRDYKVRDIVELKGIERVICSKDELLHSRYTGFSILVRITHILTHEESAGLADGYVMLSFEKLKDGNKYKDAEYDESIANTDIETGEIVKIKVNHTTFNSPYRERLCNWGIREINRNEKE